MTCDTVLPILEDYFDGELDATSRRTVEAHLAACPACTAELAALEQEQQVFARYDRGFEPSPDMWSAVRSRIEHEAGHRGSAEGWFRSLTAWLGGLVAPSQLVPIGAAAFALVLAVAVGFVAMRDTTPEPLTASEPGIDVTPVQPPQPTPVPPDTTPIGDVPKPVPPPTGYVRTGAERKARGTRPAPVEPTLPAPVADAERRYLQAIALLTKDIERSSVGIDAKSRDDWNKPLEALDRNIDAARRAVRKNPDDPTAVLSMLSAYDSKVETLQTMALLQDSNDR